MTSNSKDQDLAAGSSSPFQTILKKKSPYFSYKKGFEHTRARRS